MIKPEELCELRGSCTVLWEREGEIPLRDPINGNAFSTDETNEANNKSISINIPLDKLRADVHTSQDDRRVFRP